MRLKLLNLLVQGFYPVLHDLWARGVLAGWTLAVKCYPAVTDYLTDMSI